MSSLLRAVTALTCAGAIAVLGLAPAAAQKTVSATEGPVTLTVPATISLTPNRCVNAPYSWSIAPSVAAQQFAVTVRTPDGAAIAGDVIEVGPVAVASFDDIAGATGKPQTGKGTLRFCGKAKPYVKKFAGPWAAARSGSQSITAVAYEFSGGAAKPYSVTAKTTVTVSR